MEPSKKDDLVEETITGFAGFDRRDSIVANRCVPPPMGCAREIPEAEFETWDRETLKEYTISGLCKACQFIIFGGDPNCGLLHTDVCGGCSAHPTIEEIVGPL